jgi:hypothetical protein
VWKGFQLQLLAPGAENASAQRSLLLTQKQAVQVLRIVELGLQQLHGLHRNEHQAVLRLDT